MADPAFTASRTTVTIDGNEIASFSEIISISSEADPTSDDQARLELRRAMSGSLDLYSWHDAVMDQKPDSHRNCVFTVFNTSGKPVVKFWAERVCPRTIEIETATGGPMVERVTFQAARMRRLAI